MNSDRLSVALFFAVISMWMLMMYYTLVPWALGVELETNKQYDISPLTWTLVMLAMTSSVLWFAIQIAYLFAKGRLAKMQAALIRDKRYYGREPLVSVLIPARNEEAVIKRTIVSCLAQTYKNIEVIVICHNCTDRTYYMAQSADRRVRVFDYKTKESGKGVALNFGVEQSRGEYLLVIDSDGILANDFIANALPMFDKGFVAVQGKIMASNTEYNIIAKLLALEGYLFSTPFMTIRSLLDRRTPLGGTGCMIRKDKLAEVGGFKNALIDDFELSFRFFRHKYRIAFAPLSVVYDEKPPQMALMLRQRSRWVKGHFDLLKERIPERTDVMGTIYWLNPLFMLSGMAAIAISSFAVLNYILFGSFPYAFSFIPINLWLGITIASFVIQSLVLVRDFGVGGLKYIGHAGLLTVFSHYWYVTLVRSFFVKSWSTTKTTHGFMSARDVERMLAEQQQQQPPQQQKAKAQQHAAKKDYR